MKKVKDDVRTTMTKTHRGELVLSDLPQDRIYGFVPNGYGQSSKITEQRTENLNKTSVLMSDNVTKNKVCVSGDAKVKNRTQPQDLLLCVVHIEHDSNSHLKA